VIARDTICGQARHAARSAARNEKAERSKPDCQLGRYSGSCHAGYDRCADAEHRSNGRPLLRIEILGLAAWIVAAYLPGTSFADVSTWCDGNAAAGASPTRAFL
jgi:hypothetical protein